MSSHVSHFSLPSKTNLAQMEIVEKTEQLEEQGLHVESCASF